MEERCIKFYTDSTSAKPKQIIQDMEAELLSTPYLEEGISSIFETVAQSYNNCY